VTGAIGAVLIERFAVRSTTPRCDGFSVSTTPIAAAAP
jgi:hypothetical protein